MPRDKDKDNASRRGSRERIRRGEARQPRARGGDKTFAKRPDRNRRDDEGRPHRADAGKRPYRSRDDRGERPDRFRDDRGGKRDFKSGRGERQEFRGGSGDRMHGRDNRGERSDFSRDRGKRDDFRADRGGRDRFREDAPRKRFDRRERDAADAKPRREQGERPRGARRGQDRDFEARRSQDRPRFAGQSDDRRRENRAEFDRPRFERPRRDAAAAGERFTKRPAFGGRGAYRDRDEGRDRGHKATRTRGEESKPQKTGERIAKVLARAGLASRRDAETWVVQGRVAVNGRIINSPALDVTPNDRITVDGAPLPERERTRLFLYHKPRGLMTTHADPEGRPTVFDNLPEGLPRLISVGRLDYNTEGLLLLTNDGGVARVLELPETGWLRRYRVRAHGEVTQAQLDQLKNGIEVDGVKYGPIDATLERDQGANVWLVFAIREGKNREVRNVLAHLGLEVNRLIRVSYGPFQLGDLTEGAVDEVKTRVLREQLGEKVIAQAGADFAMPSRPEPESDQDANRPGKRVVKPAGKSALIADRKGRRVLVQRTGSQGERDRDADEAQGYGPPRRPKRGYHGKRDFKPRDS